MVNKNNYIKATTFSIFCSNQEKLIGILNHRMTGVEENMKKIGFSMEVIKNDVCWLKKLLWIITGLATTIFGTIIIKTLFGM